MPIEERRVVSDQPVEPVNTVPADETVVEQPATVVQRRPVRRAVVTEDPVSNAYAASQMITTIVWAVVVLVLLAVALLALHVYAHLF